ncbi:MAG: ATP-binding protein, partial [Chitinophagaceae bacterium]
SSIIGISSDITEKKKMEKLLDKANTMARIGNFEIDLVENTVYWSDITRQIHEADNDFYPNFESSLRFLKTPADRELLGTAINDLIEKGTPINQELQIVTARGNDKWVRVLGEPEFHDGRCEKISGSFQDINERKKSDLELYKVFTEKNDILESIQDAFYALDKDWTVTYWNKEAESLLERKRENIVGKNLWFAFPDMINTPFFIIYHEALTKNRVHHFEEYYETLKIWVDVSIYPSANGLSVYFRDVTERKLYEIRLNKLNQNLQEHARELATSNKELEQFAYVTSHDLQEPLRMITSFLSLIEKKYGNLIDEKGKQYIHFAVDGAKRMRQIILDLLEFSKVGKTHSNNLETVDLNEVLSDIIFINRKQIDEINAVVEVGNLPVLQSYRTPLHQLFKNLVCNALIYHKPGVAPHIIVSCESNTDQWLFEVKDNGIGIDPEYFEKIFIMFQRLHNKDEFSGTGIGLAICKKIIENFNGKIWVESEIGKGSCFYFTIVKNRCKENGFTGVNETGKISIVNN